MAENGKIEPEKYGSLLQHSFSTLMDDTDSDTISERSSNQGGSELLELHAAKMKSPRNSVVSKENPLNGNYLNVTPNQRNDSLSPRTSSSSESGNFYSRLILILLNY